MKKILFLAPLAALALASCSNEDLSEDVDSISNGSKAISFVSGTSVATRATHVGADAAAKLNNKFIVSGFKGAKSTDGVVTKTVYDNYIVNWNDNTAGTSESNTSDWEYVGVTAAAPSSITGAQTIKYWDYSSGQYDFIAYSTGDATAITTGAPTGTQVLVSAISAANAKTAAYTLQGSKDALAKCYIADLVTAYYTAVTGKPEFGNEVSLSFRNMACKARVALYETIPGYSVKDVYFYTEGSSNNAAISADAQKSATLFTSGATDADKFFTAGTATVSFPNVGTGKLANSDYNKAHVSISATASGTTQTFGTLDYKLSDDTRLGEADADKKYLGTTTTTASYAGTDYTTVLPNETGTTLTLRVNYTLVSNDNSGETITVYGAKAVVPAIYAQWKSNYAYTYIFKISDKTNGKTGMTVGEEGLYPITFDAVTVDAEDGTQATITTVATPSITTYQKGHDVAKNEYSAATGAIFVTVDGKTDLGTNGQLYTVTGTNITEATVHDALTIGATTSGTTTTGRNGIALTTATSDATITAVPGADDNDISVTAGTYASFTPSTGTYAYVYKLTDGTASELHTAVVLSTEPSDWSTADYYTDEACTKKATTYADGTYYQKVTNTNNTYAVKVIKVVA